MIYHMCVHIIILCATIHFSPAGLFYFRKCVMLIQHAVICVVIFSVLLTCSKVDAAEEESKPWMVPAKKTPVKSEEEFSLFEFLSE